MIEKICGYELIGIDGTPSVSCKVSVDPLRFFVVKISQYGEKIEQSKTKTTIRFKELSQRS